MRMGATLAHALPGLSLSLLDRGTEILRVSGAAVLAEHSALGRPGQVVRPCYFRIAVAGAYRRMVCSGLVPFMHLPAGADPQVLVVSDLGREALGGPIYRVRVGAAAVDAFTTTLHPNACHEAMEGWSARQAIRVCGDPLTEVTVVHTIVDPRPWSPPRPSPLVDILARCTAEELIGDLYPSRPNRR